MFQSPGEIAFYIFKLPVYFYGIILAVAIFTGVCCTYYLYRKFYDAQKAEYIFDIAPYLIVLGIIGARLYYCLVNFSYYAKFPIEIFYVRQGGLSIHGMIFTGIIALFIFSKIYKMEFLKLTDAFLCSVPLAQSIGRWGNFFNSEAFGYPTDLPWKLYIPFQNRPPEFINFEYFHPTFLYESILDLLIFLILFYLFKKFTNKPGLISGLYLILYSIIRLIIEQIRIDSALNIGSIPIAQLMSIILIIIGIILCCFVIYKKRV